MASRPTPGSPAPVADDAERRHTAGLMRVNHAGEIAGLTTQVLGDPPRGPRMRNAVELEAEVAEALLHHGPGLQGEGLQLVD